MITIAIAKGRMQDDALALLARAGVRLGDDARNSRRLAIEDESGRYRFVFVKPADVPVYVEHGIADCGVVGRDVLLECRRICCCRSTWELRAAGWWLRLLMPKS